MTGPDRVLTIELVDAGLDRVNRAMDRGRIAHVRGRLDRAGLAARMTVLHRRRARWWAVLERTTINDAAVHVVYLRAVVLARGEAEESARWWSEEVARVGPARPRVAR
ncbi:MULTISPECIES: hypothetical protein [unclassified Pseudonocardia]|uniref:hypothetical protein n=1 Tax=unclassified Pseudonocardia TaxID=2619320 RepID=UPI0001FFE2BB|nr:hypothetical protein [Pseudonocardia sp. Ae707_Ps1]